MGCGERERGGGAYHDLSSSTAANIPSRYVSIVSFFDPDLITAVRACANNGSLLSVRPDMPYDIINPSSARIVQVFCQVTKQQQA